MVTLKVTSLAGRPSAGMVEFRLTLERQDPGEAGAPGYATVVAGRCCLRFLRHSEDTAAMVAMRLPGSCSQRISGIMLKALHQRVAVSIDGAPLR